MSLLPRRLRHGQGAELVDHLDELRRRLPVILLGVVRLGILSSARLRRNRRIGIVALAVASVALPGVDPATTVLQTIPLLVLFEASIWAAVYFERRWQRSPIRPEPVTVADSS